MLFTFLAVLAASPTAAVRPELTRASMSTNVARVKSLISEISSPIETKAAMQAAAGIVDGILAETGNATEHMSDDDAALLREVVDLIEKSIYGSMDSAHGADERSLADGLAAVEACNADITARQAPNGDLGKLHKSVSDDQSELDRLQGVVDDETSNNASAWDTFDNHMQMIGPSPGCPAFPSKTMRALDVYFEKSDYVVWFTSQSAAYADAKVLWTTADAALTAALENYKIQKVIRDTQYCDWAAELEAACTSFDECFAEKSEHFNKQLVPRVQSDMNARIDNYKAGETLVHAIQFLLADVKDLETPAIVTSRYELDFPILPPKGQCDLSVLESSEWVPTPECFKCAAASASNVALASAGATCEMKHPDNVWGGGSRDCAKLLDGRNVWGSATARHMGYNERSAGREHFLIVTLPQPTAIREVKIHQAKGWEVGNFSVETQDSSGAWVAQEMFGAPIADANVRMSSPVVSSAVRMIGTPGRGNFGDFCYRMTEVEIIGCSKPSPTPEPRCSWKSLGAGWCREPSGAKGSFTVLTGETAESCRAKCVADSACVAVELHMSAGGKCELHHHLIDRISAHAAGECLVRQC